MLSLFCVFLILPVVLTAPRCETFNNDGSVCKGMLPYEKIVVPTNTCQDKLESKLQYFPSLWKSLGDECGVAVSSLMCQQIFPGCADDNAPITPCREVCEEARTKCGTGVLEALAKMDSSLLNCTHYRECPVCEQCGPTEVCKAGRCIGSDMVVPKPTTYGCVPYTGVLCKDFIDWDVLMPQDSTPEEMEEVVGGYLKFLPLVGQECQGAIYTLACNLFFPPCEKQSAFLTLSVDMPRLPCYSLCTNLNEKCADAMSLLPKNFLKFHCNSTTTKPTRTQAHYSTTVCGKLELNASVRLFPEKETVFTEYPLVLRTECNAKRANASSVQALASSINCPYPMTRFEGQGDTRTTLGACSLGCPIPFFSEEQVQTMEDMFSAFVGMSLIFGGAMLITMVVFKEKREKAVILWFTVAMFLLAGVLSIGWLSSRTGNFYDMGCKDDTHIILQADGGFCVFQGWAIWVLSEAIIAWWFVYAFDIYRKIVKMERLTKQGNTRRMMIYHACCWGVPMLFSIPAAVHPMGGYGGSTGTQWCFVAYSTPTWLLWVFFHAPIMTSMFVGFYLFTKILITIRGSDLRTKKCKQNRGSSLRSTYFRSTLFIGVILLLFFVQVVVACVWDFYGLSETFVDHMRSFYSCLMTATVEQRETMCGKSPSTSPESTKDMLVANLTSIWYVSAAVVGGQGVLCCMIWGLDYTNLKLWRGFFRKHCLRQRGSNNSADRFAPRVVTTRARAATNRVRTAGTIQGSPVNALAKRSKHRSSRSEPPCVVIKQGGNSVRESCTRDSDADPPCLELEKSVNTGRVVSVAIEQDDEKKGRTASEANTNGS